MVEVVYETASKAAIAPFFYGSILVAMVACMLVKVVEIESPVTAAAISGAPATYVA